LVNWHIYLPNSPLYPSDGSNLIIHTIESWEMGYSLWSDVVEEVGGEIPAESGWRNNSKIIKFFKSGPQSSTGVESIPVYLSMMKEHGEQICSIIF
jgi:hypothetical protein